MTAPIDKAGKTATHMAARVVKPGVTTTSTNTRIIAQGENAIATGAVSGTDRFLSRVQSVANSTSTVLFALPLVGGLFVKVAGLFSKSASTAVGKKIEMLETTSLESVAKAPALGKHFDAPIQNIAQFLEDAGKATGFTAWRINSNAAKGDKLLGRATTLTATLQGAHPSLQPHFDTITRTIQHGAETKTLNLEALSSSQQAIKDALAADASLKKVAQSHLKTVEKAIDKATAGFARHQTAAGYHNVTSTVTQAIKNVPKASLLTVTANSGFALATGVSTVAVTKGIIEDTHGLQEMAQDAKSLSVEEAKKINSKIVSKEKGRLEKSAAVKLAAEALGVFMTVAQIAKGNISMSTMMKFALPQMAVGAASQMMGQSAGRYYDVLKKNYAKNKVLAAEDIAEFIAVASPELRKRGGLESAFSMEIARQFAAEGLTPVQILKEIADGLKPRVDKITAVQQEAKAHPETVAAVESRPSFADRVSGKKSGEVVGKGTHTGKLSEAAAEPSTGLSV